MACLKNIQYYETEDKKLSFQTGYNTCLDTYETNFSSGMTSRIKTKKLYERNILFWSTNYGLKKVDFIPKYFQSSITQNPD